jgi:predicted CXXCH cytochrome family protein
MKYKLLFTAFAILITSSIAIGQNYYLGTDNGSGYLTCSSCHSSNTAVQGMNISPVYDTWKLTPHAKAYDSNVKTLSYSCLPCHTTGWDTTVVNYGADEYVKYDASKSLNYVITDSAGFNRVKNVGCEDCHGPLGTKDHFLSDSHYNNKPDYSSAVCGKCHQGYFPYYEEWKASKHAMSTSASLSFVLGNKTCVKCHVAQNFVAYAKNPTGYRDTILVTGSDIQPITCSACHDPHDAKYPGQLRFQTSSNRVICDECHYEQITSVDVNSEPHEQSGLALSGDKNFGYQYPGQTYSNSAHTYAAQQRCINCHVDMSPNADGSANMGHTFEPRVQACYKCHSDYYTSVDTSNHAKMFDYRGEQTTTDSLMNVLALKLKNATSSDSATMEFKEANYNLLAVESDGSHGIHNTKLIQKLLVDAINSNFSTPTGIKNNYVAPVTYSLSQNYPNPFNPTTVINFSIAEAGNVKIIIYDVIGKEVKTLVNSYYSKGSYQVTWNASSFPSGVYFYRIESKNFTMVKKMILLK